MNSRIRIRHLEAFVAIAREKQLKRAAEKLGLTQPAISKTLKDLEQILEVTLMERGRAGILLSAKGEVFLQFAEQSIAALNTGVNTISARGPDGSARLSIGVLPSAAATLLPTASEVFRKTSPNVLLCIEEGPHGYLTNKLRAGALDLVIGRLGRPASMAGLSFTQLYTETVVIVAAPDHPLAGATHLSELAGANMIYPAEESAIRPLLARLLIAQGLPLFEDRIESVSGAFGRAMVLGPARAIWFISKGVVKGDLDTGRMVQLDIDMRATTGPVGLMTRSEDVANAPMQMFRNALIKGAKMTLTNS
ncbi:pca operon transcription factor PcaQ [Sedimentitalea nanhaiensis]|uniref:LysR family transcriptional regulator, pca operon transcriptional activator n=1 Tax=Sedimentitalea nanhaiensis TaxID=999627 RepID=A0A1I7EAC4_9RHOB|nr:pca operon transcription factor PcaQ [Sedimentitalea nanhaiensis]SFU20884.1 LysR family transcriptional regulator, pca operon transcriptional activator [Sedimentitalea nanhaiensis]